MSGSPLPCAQPAPRGMDHALYDFEPLPARPALSFGTRRLAACLVLPLEHWELAPPEGSLRDPRFKGEFGTFAPEFRTWSSRAYGNRVGVWRILSLLDEFGVAPTVALGAAVVQTHPELVAEIVRRGWEVAVHGFSANRMISARMDEAEERAFIVACRDIVASACPTPLRGWLGQDHGLTPRTGALLREAGFAYTLDWPNDDQPYWQATGELPRGLVALPAPTELDDVQTIALRRIAPERFPGLVRDMLDGAAALPEGRVFSIGIHPWLFGAQHRIRYLRQTLELLRERSDLLVTTAGDIADRFIHCSKERPHVA
jgi:peptidoglycan/xylan/chitin deacetylase (PgdA/CDA1 family)